MQNDKMELIQSFLQDHAKHSYETQDLLNKYSYENLGFAQQTSGFRIVWETYYAKHSYENPRFAQQTLGFRIVWETYYGNT